MGVMDYSGVMALAGAAGGLVANTSLSTLKGFPRASWNPMQSHPAPPTISAVDASSGLSNAYTPANNSAFAYAGGTSVWNSLYARDQHNASFSGVAPFNVTFACDATVVEIDYYRDSYGEGPDVEVDGQYAGFPASGTINSRHTFYLTFASQTTRIITLRGRFYLCGVRTNSASGIYAAPTAQRPRVLVLGDSYSEPTTSDAAASRARHGWLYQLGLALNWDVWSCGAGGTGYVKTNGSRGTFGSRVATDVTPWSPDIVIVSGGINDGGRVSDYAAYQTTVEQCIANIRAGCSASIILTGPIWRGYAGSGTSDQERIGAAIVAAGSKANLFIPTANWITGTGKQSAPAGNGNADVIIGPDNVHPTIIGHAYIAMRMSNAILALG